MSLAASVLPLDILKAPAATTAPVAPSAGEQAKRAAIARTAKDFEASFLSTALSTMFQGVSAGTFGGGAGEDAFKSFLTEAFAKQTAKGKGIGLAASVQHEMLKLQGLQ